MKLHVIARSLLIAGLTVFQRVVSGGAIFTFWL